MKYGRYEIVSEIGRGSMGVVYEAHDPQIDRLVALKVLREDRVSSDEYVKRFLKEATAVGRLSHSGIVTVYDVGQDHGTVYIAMELLEGTPLNELMKSEKIPFERICGIGKEVAQALHYAHQKGIVHRDIKPANIICAEDGTVKVTDFGIAHIDDPEGQQMTQAGEILGTPVYMSPEQVLGQTVDGRSDIYSLGVILYELVTGKRPFQADNIGALFKAITNDPVESPVRIRSEVPAWFSRVVMKALSRDPGHRYSSGAAMVQDIEHANRVEKVAGRTPRKRSTVPMVILAAMLMVGGAGALYYLGYLDRLPGVIGGLIPSGSEVENAEVTTAPSQPDERKQTDEPKTLGPVEREIPEKQTEQPVQRPAEARSQADAVKEKDGKIHGKDIGAVEAVVSAEKTRITADSEKTGAGTPSESVEQVSGTDQALEEDMDIFTNPAFDTNKKNARPNSSVVQDEAGAGVRQEEVQATVALPETRTRPIEQPAGRKEQAVEKKLEEEDLAIFGIEQKKDEQAPLASAGQDKPFGVRQTQQVEAKNQEPELEPNRKGESETMTVASLPPPTQKLAAALVKMKSRPQGASVYIDGEYIGKTPIEHRLSAEKHEVVLQLQGHSDWKAQLDLSRGGDIPLSVRLLPK